MRQQEGPGDEQRLLMPFHFTPPQVSAVYLGMASQGAQLIQETERASFLDDATRALCLAPCGDPAVAQGNLPGALYSFTEVNKPEKDADGPQPERSGDSRRQMAGYD